MLVENEGWKQLRLYAERIDVSYEVLLKTLMTNNLNERQIKTASRNFKKKHPAIERCCSVLLRQHEALGSIQRDDVIPEV